VRAYAIKESYFDVSVMLGMGVLGSLLERRNVPLGPVVLGIILGGASGGALRIDSYQFGGLATRLLQSSGGGTSGGLCVTLWVSTIVWNWWSS